MKKSGKSKVSFSIPDILTLFFVFLYALAASLVSLHRFWQYEVFYYDFGIFDTALWKVAHFQAPIIDHLAIGGRMIFADHFSPSLFLLSPLYWFTSRQEVMLVAQALCVAASGLVLYAIGKKVLTDNRLAGALTVSYLLFIGLQNALITDIHEVTFMTLPLMLTFLAVVTNSPKRFWVFFFITLGCKESTFLLGIGLGMWLLTMKSWRKTGVWTIVASIIWGLFAIKLAIPYFSGGVYNYTPILPSNLLDLPMTFVDNPIKIKTMLISFGSFLFLPLLAPAFWPMILQDLLTRFVPADSFLRWDVGLHYSAQLAPILAVSGVYGARVIITKAKTAILPFMLAVLLLATTIVLHQLKLHGPLGLSYNPAFYRHTRDFAFLDDLVARVPKGATVMTQNNLAVRYTHQQVWLFRTSYTPYMPDYILADLRDGQNPNNLFPQTKEKILKMKDALLLDPEYKLIIATRDQFLFQKKAFAGR